MPVAIEAVAVSKRYGTVLALDHCSIRIPEGRIVALVGPNGAGKTTFLQLVFGLLKSDGGQIGVFGLSPTSRHRDLLPRVGFLAQDRPLYRDFSVADCLEYGRRLNPAWDQGLAQTWISRLEIPLRQRVGGLSGGQQAQVALLTVVAKRAELILLDEPVSGLDPLARKEFLRALIEVAHERKLTVVLSSHIVSELEQTCDHLVILSRGQVQIDGEIAVLLALHRTVSGPSSQSGWLENLDVIQVTRAGGQVEALVRSESTSTDAIGVEHPVDLEQLVLAYLSRGRSSPDSLDRSLERGRR